MNGRLTTAIQIDSEVPVTFDASMEIPVTPPSMKLLDRRNPWSPIVADRMPSRTRNELSSSRRNRFTPPSYDARDTQPSFCAASRHCHCNFEIQPRYPFVSG